MISLQDVCDLPIEFDDLDNDFKMPECLHCRRKKDIPIESLAHTLLNSAINYPKSVYSEYSVFLEEDEQVFAKDELNYDLLVIPAGLLGIEFIKSHIYYSPISSECNNMKFSTIVEGIQGMTTVVMQKNTAACAPGTNQPMVQEGIMIELQPKDKIAIPEGYFYTFVNTTGDTVILSRVYKQYKTAPTDSLSRTKGLAYFCIRKNAKQEFVFNPRFRNIPSIKKMSPRDNHMPELGFDLSESLYNLARLKTEKFLSILS
ncbi:hypothetical protein KC717_01970 [Candidatus Dojkabacteria bacterium]|uniref:Glucose-6-phosphate isomerase prokaryote domain-containing protein n=1 Tax=Candidatus Dojkabacteria bacterium TaxID=2099670 RepID=A0A955RKH8_9BACT|nr:hypothetical protein [Candidatus Dojkabacteria bacterium]